jgi:hypothetical protein
VRECEEELGVEHLKPKERNTKKKKRKKQRGFSE